MEKRETQERKCRKISLIFLKVKNRTRNKGEKFILLKGPAKYAPGRFYFQIGFLLPSQKYFDQRPLKVEIHPCTVSTYGFRCPSVINSNKDPFLLLYFHRTTVILK